MARTNDGANAKDASKQLTGLGNTPNISITVSGPANEVHRALTHMSFRGEWNQAVARNIALDETLVPDAELSDTLGGDRVRLFSQDARDLYRQRCVNEAGRRGHPVPDPSQITVDEDTLVGEVGDDLFKNARP